jgi:hypothetical protein
MFSRFGKPRICATAGREKQASASREAEQKAVAVKVASDADKSGHLRTPSVRPGLSRAALVRSPVRLLSAAGPSRFPSALARATARSAMMVRGAKSRTRPAGLTRVVGCARFGSLGQPTGLAAAVSSLS